MKTEYSQSEKLFTIPVSKETQRKAPFLLSDIDVGSAVTPIDGWRVRGAWG